MLAIDGPDDESGHVVLAIGVEAGHLGGLAAKERTSVLTARDRQAFDYLHGHVGIEPAGREVVEKEEGNRPLDENVVDAVVHEVPTHGVVDAGHEGYPQL